jgi:hypothetical protein
MFVRRARLITWRCKSTAEVDSGQLLAKGKGVVREDESEGSRSAKIELS